MYPDETIGRPYPKAWIIGKQLTNDKSRFKTRTPKKNKMKYVKGLPYPKAWAIGNQLTADGKRFSTRVPKTDSPRTTDGSLQGRTGPLDDERADGSGGVAGCAA